MRLPPSTLSKAVTATSTLDRYLSTLKATHLKALARATGIPSSGRKDELRQRIGGEVVRSAFLHNNKNTKKTKRRRRNGNDDDDDVAAAAAAAAVAETRKELSVLSIDMGIQNLAVAHLIVQKEKSDWNVGEDGDGSKEKGVVKLNAWHRIGVQELRREKSGLIDDGEKEGAGEKDILRSMLPAAAFRTFTTTNNNNTKTRKKNTDSTNEEEIEAEEDTVSAKTNTFDPDQLSQNAFILLSALLKAYNPTHILIERQRFRSGGQRAVLEWSLRVGVFEGMLHAVLRTMREINPLHKHNDLEDGNAGMEVYGISPARVMQFWDVADAGDDGTGGEKDERAQRNVKRLKMDIIGELLMRGQKEPSLSSTESTTKSRKGSRRESQSISSLSWAIDVNSLSPTQNVVDAYLRRWNGVTTPRSSTARIERIEKMDDLADCLLQGLTWLEWQARQASIVIEHGDGPT